MATAIAINTEALGRLTYTDLNRRVKAAGSKAALAREVGVDPSTVRTWAHRLNTIRASRNS